MPYKLWLRETKGDASRTFVVNGKAYLFVIKGGILTISLNQIIVLVMIHDGDDFFVDLLFNFYVVSTRKSQTPLL